MQKVIYEVIILEETQHFKVIKINNEEIFSIVKMMPINLIKTFTKNTPNTLAPTSIAWNSTVSSMLIPISNPIKPPITIRADQPSFCFYTRFLYQFRLQKPRNVYIKSYTVKGVQFPKWL